MNVAEKAELAYKMVMREPVISFDVETTGLDWKREQPIGYVVGTIDHPSVYVPVRHTGGGNLASESVGRYHKEDVVGKYFGLREPPTAFEWNLALAFDLRNQKEFVTVGHNIKFDAHFAANAGIALGRNLRDTQIQEALLDENKHDYSLDTTAKKYGGKPKLGEGLYKHIAELTGCSPTRDAAMGNFHMLPGTDHLAVEYAEADGDATLDVYFMQMGEILLQDLHRVMQVESNLIWTLFRMERYGWKIDEAALNQLAEETIAVSERLRNEFPPDFSERSPNDLIKLFTDAGIPKPWPSTAKGNTSFREEWLETFELGQKVLTLRKATNLLNTFVGPLKSRHVFEGRVHANNNQLTDGKSGTKPGRLSMSNPNLQQVPKRNVALAIPFRKVFIVDEGCELIDPDYSQCEPRLFAHYTKEPRLVNGYNADPPLDMHDVAKEILGLEDRDFAKRLNMGLLLLMGAPTLAGHLRVARAEAEEYRRRWYEAFPGIEGFQKAARSRMLRRGYVTTLLGRRGRMTSPRMAYMAVSRVIQGGNADILKYKMVEVDRYIEDMGIDGLAGPWSILASVHDAIPMQVPKRGVYGDLLDIMEEVQGPPFNLSVPFVVDCKPPGQNWAEASFGKEQM